MKDRRFVAKTLFGLEDVLVAELRELGAKKINKGTRAVEFEANKEVLYKVNYACRVALRVLEPLMVFKTKHENHFYKKVREYDWTKLVGASKTLAIDGVTQSKYITHSKYMALKAKDAVVDRIRADIGRRPSVELNTPDVRLNVHLSRDNVCTVSWDTSGSSLHKRGYRRESGEAPINEVLAAGILQIVGWKGEGWLVDPMCGSGTIAIEAAMVAGGVAAQRHRQLGYGFMKSDDWDVSLWNQVRSGFDEKARTLDGGVLASDVSGEAISMAKYNAAYAGVDGFLDIKRRDIAKLKAPHDAGIMVFNPPYDERIIIDEVESFYGMLGDVFKNNWKGWMAWMISHNMQGLKRVGLRSDKKVKLYNGKLDCRLVGYDIYDGSKREAV